MNHSHFWLLCLLGFALLNQGMSRPQETGEDYAADGDYPDEDEDPDYDEAAGPAPRIISSGIELVVEEGGVVLMPCDVEGNPDRFSRVWKKEKQGLFVGSITQQHNERINLMPNGSLEIRQVQPGDSGTYSCMISADEEVHHTLKIRSPAKITRITPSDNKSVIRRNSSLTLECIAQGYPTPSIKWFKDGHVLENQDPSIHGARYIITSASLEDSGIYKCTATNGQQLPDERTVEIEVHYPPQVKIARAIVPSGEGYESELKCIVTGMKKPELKWYRSEEQKPITPSQRVKFERSGHDHILRIMKTQDSDFGDYICEAKNSEGQEQAVITLTGKPSRPEPDTVVTDGETKNPLLTFRVESFAPILDYELLYKKEDQDEWVSEKPVVVAPAEGRFYSVKHVLTKIEPGVYNAQLKAKNVYGWSELSSKITFPKEHEGDLTETGLLAVEVSTASELRISLALVVSLLVAHFYC